ncbi:hypothetical protein HNY73_014161 [Argiope bruennichi]|uniref:Uncharacterized protein n=1 Tax=Argiope bruennichi TaxID=94029 RepID=A0A8T0ES33_ARGBR|nr:hypothetical protein HNY73_014161 [Argiope bruennichi]
MENLRHKHPFPQPPTRQNYLQGQSDAAIRNRICRLEFLAIATEPLSCHDISIQNNNSLRGGIYCSGLLGKSVGLQVSLNAQVGWDTLQGA